MPQSQPGEVWQVDLGLAAKVRPAAILSDYPSGDELALVLIAPHTTLNRGTRWELDISVPFLKPGAFHLQRVQPLPIVKLERRLDQLINDQLRVLKRRLVDLLSLLN